MDEFGSKQPSSWFSYMFGSLGNEVHIVVIQFGDKAWVTWITALHTFTTLIEYELQLSVSEYTKHSNLTASSSYHHVRACTKIALSLTLAKCSVVVGEVFRLKLNSCPFSSSCDDKAVLLL